MQTGGRAGDLCAVPSDCCQNSCIAGFCCVVTPCSGHVLQCNDCIDNDGDGLIDSRDPECLGPCDNTEVPNLNADVGGETGGPCQSDCYFDFGNGSGNDNCFWDHRCDPFEVAPNYYPEGPTCEYDPGRVGTRNCPATQSATCLGFCLPITPNGCDCFGCCTFPALAGMGPGGTDGFVWIQHLDASGDGTCTLAAVTDPAACPPCTPVPDCINPCEACELCVGRPTLPPGCIPGDRCEPGVEPCGQPGDADCPADFYCITGCCQLAP
jgi:hypothetical protein